MKTLFTIAKLIPKLGTENEHEKTTTLRMIETLLKKESISWTDVGQQLESFLKETLGFIEEEKKPSLEEKTSASSAASGSGWASQSTTTYNTSRAQARAWSNPPPNNPPPPPPPPPPMPSYGKNWRLGSVGRNQTWIKFHDPRVTASRAQRILLVEEMLQKGPSATTHPLDLACWTNQKERQFLLSIKMMLEADLPLTVKQESEFRKKSENL